MEKLVDVNRATREELIEVRGIGASLADRIIGFREENGPLKSMDDLMKIPGIKEGTVKLLGKVLSVGKRKNSGKAADTEKEVVLEKAASAKSKRAQGSHSAKYDSDVSPDHNTKSRKFHAEAQAESKKNRRKTISSGEGAIDLNTITEDELAKIKDIGESIAERIVQFRKEHGGFFSVDDIEDVPLMDMETAQKLKDNVVLGKARPKQSSRPVEVELVEETLH